ncbi:MAG: N-acetylmuramoyl-L-alanine amidase [Proteobacteria bacterium]|nr:N-acetylmuramoyl-L-alanine amidase [Pseudomonadota bacterium]MBU1584343.1 N-acetylmuramoyl-L-alanine amidase [Pseudomonadota bacterium]MBU2454959.1 N-acetylmuramoyl-L-alanine amidase [Pseudomonadota bacterium]MBU2627309.1 N-acetylmuramoyl-L-alanine amidase [Pseudomonadota bacterium]
MAYFQTPKDDRLDRYDHLIVHCTATRADMNEVDAAWVDHLHKNIGWSGCGYHAVMTRSGQVQLHDDGYPARPVTKQGAHVGDCGAGWNRRSFGISLAGGVDADNSPENNFTEHQFTALRGFIQEFLDAHPRPETIKIMGHRDLIRQTHAPGKACPCFDVSAFLLENEIFAVEEDIAIPNTHSHMRLPKSYTVKQGDTLWGISQLFGVSVEFLTRKNALSEPLIHPGQILEI